MHYRTLLFVLLFSLNLQSVSAENWPFLDVHRMGASDFIKANPAYNGKDVAIIILDTGVDMGVPGLNVLPDGSPKVIDAQDFSGEGDVPIYEAESGTENGQEFLTNQDDIKVFGITSLELSSVDSNYYLGFLDEERFKNTVLPDINNSGKSNDRFAVLVFKADQGWVAYVDLDADGNVDDEKPFRNYKDELHAFQFRGRNAESDRNLATFALNIFPEEKRVNFHYDGSSHGTHVAGLAAGYKINDQDGLNGIAPGAKIVSLKIGDCRLSGGATTTGSMQRAYDYGIEFAKEFDGPVVFNMSFGIGSEIEGQSLMDYAIDQMLTENENLFFCTSAGNEGPGISTVGLPAAAKRILTVGAMNPKETANQLYGAHLTTDKIFVFSSRGGELNKPDILAPGGASSTVPPFSGRDVKWGTSMASPQAAGAVALVMSAAHQNGIEINGAILKKALKNAADPLPGYAHLEQGNGVINIRRAFKFYKKMIEQDEQSQVLDYDINTVSPVYPNEDGRAAYWRFGTYAPDKNHKQQFYINPVFAEKINADSRHNFYRAYNLKSTANWLKLNKKTTYIKGEGPAIVDVYYDKSKMHQPGLYNAKIIACRKDGLNGGSKAINVEFELIATVVVPIVFNENNGYKWNSDPVKIKPGNVERFFFDVPAKASSATITMRSSVGQSGKVSGYLFDPAGRESHYTRFNPELQTSRTILLDKDDLEQGTWEFDLYTDFRAEQHSTVQLSISFSGLEIEPASITSVQIENGADPEGIFTVLNNYNELADCKISGEINGLQRRRHIVDSRDKYEYFFTVSKDITQVQFEIEMDAEVYNLFTDFAINIKDFSGKVLKGDGLSYRKKKLSFRAPESGEYILEFIPGFAAIEPSEWDLMLTETFEYRNKIAISGVQTEFYPRVKKEADFTVEGQLPVAPDGFYLFGEIWLDTAGAYKSRTVVPLKLHTGFNE